ncbi:glycosyltransferase [Lactobacillus delbrueckii subsp. lactis]|uniref:glycosyltransferase n=1 Tax=Lactobacillus delbrueckii TaxID=1584 RepID=UPI001E56F042|nr:glycosyltransferase [Lactobacillus delbrueckii]MCD5598261.1 glycosyltransferase [Lactobacillus delbrueckii subsp. lactis]
MRILQYTTGLPPVRRGGLPAYSTDLSRYLSKSNEVTVVYPGRMPFYNTEKVKFNRRNSKKYPFKIFEMWNPLPVSLGYGIDKAAPYYKKRGTQAIVAFLSDINPDVIHLHTIIGLPIEFLEVARKMKSKIIYTTHDYFGLCPKMLANNSIEELRKKSCSYECMLCKRGPNLAKLKLMQTDLYSKLKDGALLKKIRQEQKGKISIDVSDDLLLPQEEAISRYNQRKYYLDMFSLIDQFHFNSYVTKEYFEHFSPDINGTVINITHSGLTDNRESNHSVSNENVRIGFVGTYDSRKGFFVFCRAIKKIRESFTNFSTVFYGDVTKNEIFDEPWAKNNGVVSAADMKDAYKKMDILVLPSLWKETFGFVVLEALSSGIPCLVSNNVGAKDLVPSEWIFSGEQELIYKVEKILKDPQNILAEMKKSVQKLNLPLSFDEHAQKIIEEFYH